jgi:hypothetical protein
VGIPSWMGFFRAQLVVVSCLFGGNPFVDGILGHNLLLSQAFSVGIPLWTGFKLSRSLSFFYNRTLAIRGPFSQTFLFLRWNSGYQEALRTNSSFFTMEFWLSRSLSHNFFHDGILAIKKPFSRFFSFFTMEFWLSGSLSHEFFPFFTMEFWLSGSVSHELFSFFTMKFWLLGSRSHELFSRWNSGNTQFGGKALYIYIYIYIYIHVLIYTLGVE